MNALEVDEEVQTEEERKTAKRAEQWAFVLPAMDRAFQWVKDNQKYLTTFSFQINPSMKYGVEVSLGFVSDDTERAENLRALFAGKTVEKRSKPGDVQEHYTINDDELQIRFTWTLWVFSRKQEPETVTETMTI